ncbi:MAG: hypothetical protein ABL927_01115 [Bdellovibrionales bacterium]
MRSTKYLNGYKKILMLATFALCSITFTSNTLLPTIAFAGQEKGGGNMLEAAFKATAINLAQELELIPQTIRNTNLKFAPADLLAAAYGIAPQCATGDDLRLLIRLKKLAYVKGEGTTILLNCYEQAQENLNTDWQNLLTSIKNETELSTQSKVLVTHEVLRTIGAENENSYLASGSIAATLFHLNIKEANEIDLMLLRKSDNCRIRLYISTHCGYPQSGYKVGNFVTAEIYKMDHFETLLQNVCFPYFIGDTFAFSGLLRRPIKTETSVREMVQHLRNNNCFSN